MHIDFEGSIYLLAGIITIGLYVNREHGLRRASREMIPEMDETGFEELKNLLRTCYQRTLYLALTLFYLAFVTIFNRSPQAKTFGLLLALGLFLYNIPPRNKVMRILTENGIDWKEMARRGLKL